MKLPKTITLQTNEVDECAVELIGDTLPDYLADTYGYCVRGLSYSVTVRISDIEWDKE